MLKETLLEFTDSYGLILFYKSIWSKADCAMEIWTAVYNTCP